MPVPARAVAGHAETARRAEQHPGEFVGAAGLRAGAVVPVEVRPRRENGPRRDAAARDGNDRPLLLGLGLEPSLVLLVRGQCDPVLAVGPGPVRPCGVEPGEHALPHPAPPELIHAVREVGVVSDHPKEAHRIPARPAARGGQALLLERLAHRVQRFAVGHHLEHAPNEGHRRLVHLKGAPVGGVDEAEGRRAGAAGLPLAGLLDLVLTTLLGERRPEELGYLIQHALGELADGGVVALLVERPELRAVPGELLLEEVDDLGLAGEAVPLGGEHHGDPALGDALADAGEAGTVGERRAGDPRVLDLLQDFEPLLLAVAAQALGLLPEAVAPFCLARRGHPRVEDRGRPVCHSYLLLYISGGVEDTTHPRPRSVFTCRTSSPRIRPPSDAGPRPSSLCAPGASDPPSRPAPERGRACRSRGCTRVARR